MYVISVKVPLSWNIQAGFFTKCYRAGTSGEGTATWIGFTDRDEEFYKDEIEQLELSLKLLRTILNHLTKQEKMIELMLEEMTDCEFEMNCSNCNCECERDYDQLYSCNREYFEEKAEED